MRGLWGETGGVVPRLFLLVMAAYVVAAAVQRWREQQASRRGEEPPTVEQRLAQLDELLRREVITRAEYDEARLRIISGKGGDPRDEPPR
jgi:hypothetical protein